jgi:hypothetical protein
MHPITKALTELKKAQIEATITLLDQQANVLALKSTVLELGGQKAAEALARHLAAEQSKQLAKRDEWLTVLQLLQKEIEKDDPPTTLLH